MRTLHALLLVPVVALALGTSPVPARPVSVSFSIDTAKKPPAAQAKPALVDGSWRVVP